MTEPPIDFSPEEARVLAEARLGFSPHEADLERLAQNLAEFEHMGEASHEPTSPPQDMSYLTPDGARLFSWKALVASSTLTLLTGVGVGLGISHWTRAPLVTPPPSALPVQEVADHPAPKPPPARETTEENGARETAPVSAPRRSSSKEASGKAASSELAPYDELTAVRNAQSALRSGDAVRALGLMRDLRARTKGGGLLAERGVIEVLALCQLGRADEARPLAKSLLKQTPDFPYASRLRGSCALQPEIPASE